MKRNLRFARSQKYVMRLLEISGFAAPLIETLALPKERVVAIARCLVSVQKPA